MKQYPYPSFEVVIRQVERGRVRAETMKTVDSEDFDGLPAHAINKALGYVIADTLDSFCIHSDAYGSAVMSHMLVASVRFNALELVADPDDANFIREAVEGMDVVDDLSETVKTAPTRP